MATLNIKNIPDTLYRKIKDRAKRERRSIAKEVVHILSQATEQTSTPIDLRFTGPSTTVLLTLIHDVAAGTARELSRDRARQHVA